jgi:hypothetical protein
MKRFRILEYECGAFLKICVFRILRAETLNFFKKKHISYLGYEFVFYFVFYVLKTLRKGIFVTMGGLRVIMGGLNSNFHRHAVRVSLSQ